MTRHSISDSSELPDETDDRRQTVLQRIQAALVAERLSVEAQRSGETGADPYNTGVFRNDIWTPRKR